MSKDERKQLQHNNININIEYDLIDISKQWLQDTTMPSLLPDKYFVSANKLCGSCAFFVEKQRYVVLLGGVDYSTCTDPIQGIVYFDTMYRKWNVWKQWEHTPNTIFGKTYTTNTMICMHKNYKPIILSVNSGSFPCSSELYEWILPPESLEWIIEWVIGLHFSKIKTTKFALSVHCPKL